MIREAGVALLVFIGGFVFAYVALRLAHRLGLRDHYDDDDCDTGQI